MLTSKFYTLLPFFAFIILYLGTGIYLGDFYQLPAPIAILLGVLVAFLLYKEKFKTKVDWFIQGCGDSKIITMCIVYLLAGAFAVVTKAIGGVDMMVGIGLHFIPVSYLALGIFLIGCFLSLSIGTSVGSIVALGPIVVGLAEQSGLSLGLLCGALLGGAMFGDNLSIISDTTIAATQTIGCEMRDKFKANLKFALPAALLTMIILFFKGTGSEVSENVLVGVVDLNYWLILPYIFIIALAMLGVQVFAALFLGIVVSGIIGFIQGNFTFITFSNEVYSGFTSMTAIFLLSMLTGGLAKMMEEEGGIHWILSKMKNFMTSAKSAQWGVGLLVSSINVAVANNTVAILVAGNLAKDIGEEYELPKPTLASILDIFACVVQGLLPYGAQVLILLSFTNTKLNYFELVEHAYYLFALLIITVVYMLFVSKGRKIVEPS